MKKALKISLIVFGILSQILIAVIAGASLGHRQYALGIVLFVASLLIGRTTNEVRKMLFPKV